MGEMNLATASTPHRLMGNCPRPETSLALCEPNARSAGQGKAASSVLHTSDLLSPNHQAQVPHSSVGLGFSRGTYNVIRRP